MTTTTVTLEQQLTPLAADLADIQERIAGLQQHEAELKTRIRELVPGSDSYAAGNLTIIISTNRRFDPKKAALVIPAELLPLVSVTTSVVDKERVKVLAPTSYEACFTEYDNKVALK